MIKVGVIIPTRGDRHKLLDNAIRMINAQTFQPTLVNIVDFAPGPECDITKRYREGYDWFRGMKMDVLAFWEDDDWYSPTYLATMVSQWLLHGRPELFGTNYTHYYHLRLFAHFQMTHLQRSSAMSTLIKPDLDFKWCKDTERYTDTHLWMVSALEKKLFAPEKVICIGMKHGSGKSAGNYHDNRLDRYINNDDDRSFLKQVDPESFEFYNNFFNAVPAQG